MSFGIHDYSSILNDSNIITRYFEDLKSVSDYFYPLFPDTPEYLEIDNNLMVTGYSLPLNEPGDLENGKDLLPKILPFIQNIDLKKTDYNIMLCHSPFSFFDETGLKSKIDMGLDNINLILSGHTHGGLMPKIFEKFNRGIITPDKQLFPKNVSGLFTCPNEDFSVAISRGFLKIPGTVVNELKAFGTPIYNINSLLKPDIDVLTLKKRA